MTQLSALQDVSSRGSVSPDAAQLAGVILEAEISADEAIVRTATHLLSYDRVDLVIASLTTFAPEDPTGWLRLGGRAWVRDWSRAGFGSILPPPDAGPEAALTMPWLSTRARAEGLAALTDVELLPAEAAQDRAELGRPDVFIEDLRLLNSAITARIMLEHSRRALAEAIDAGTEAQLAYQQFFGSVGHELRTPLSSVLGYAEVLLDDAGQSPQDPVSAALLRDGPAMVRACEQVLTVVDHLLGTGRALSSDDQKQDVVLAEAVADVVHWHRNPARAADVEMHVDIDPAVTAWAHPSGVRQVLANLLGNAIKHHRNGAGEVHLTTQSLSGESGLEMVRVVVRDDGPGLEADQLLHAFEPFVRFAPRDTKGSGLGLSMSRTIAERDGGAVRGESTPGVGSSFWLELPVRGS